MKKLSILSPAKINFFLDVLGERPDGYHQIITILHVISLYDNIELIPQSGEEIEIECDHTKVPQDESNLCYCAAVLIKEKCGIKHGLKIRIEKKIPVGAGLGGGSSNAAATLLGANLLWGLQLPRVLLKRWGGILGADIPFFVHVARPTPGDKESAFSFKGAALAQQKGEVLSVFPACPGQAIILVVPDFSVSTAWAYQNLKHGNTLKLGLTKQRRDIKIIENALRTVDIRLLATCLYNKLEEVVLPAHPELLQIKERISSAGVPGSLMSGSGPVIFGLTEDEGQAWAIKNKLSRNKEAYYVVRTI